MVKMTLKREEKYRVIRLIILAAMALGDGVQCRAPYGFRPKPQLKSSIPEYQVTKKTRRIALPKPVNLGGKLIHFHFGIGISRP